MLGGQEPARRNHCTKNSVIKTRQGQRDVRIQKLRSAGNIQLQIGVKDTYAGLKEISGGIPEVYINWADRANACDHGSRSVGCFI